MLKKEGYYNKEQTMQSVTNPFQALSDIFYQPSAVFNALAEKDNWSWIPFILIVIFSCLPAYMYYGFVDITWYQEAVLAGQAEEMSPAELDIAKSQMTQSVLQISSLVMGVLGPEQMQYFAHHMGKLPTGLLLRADDNEDGLWSIEEFSQLCVELIKMHGNDKFRILVEGLLESYAHKRQLHEVYWHGWALWLDYVMGISLTTLYSLALAVLFSFMGRLEEELPDMGTLPLT